MLDAWLFLLFPFKNAHGFAHEETGLFAWLLHVLESCLSGRILVAERWSSPRLPTDSSALNIARGSAHRLYPGSPGSALCKESELLYPLKPPFLRDAK